MDFNTVEMGAVELVVVNDEEQVSEELCALQLSLVGGGVGEVLFG